MLYLGNVLLLYVLIYNLKVSFNFHSTFLQLNVIENAHCAVKTVFALLSATFFELPITFSPISLEGSSYRESTALLSFFALI